jgi:hypothetical protein
VPRRSGAEPIADYDHVDGVGLPEVRVAVIGGYVYRGTSVAELMFVLDANNQVTELIAANCSPITLAVLGWVRDQHGEIYLSANGTGTDGDGTQARRQLRALTPRMVIRAAGG